MAERITINTGRPIPEYEPKKPANKMIAIDELVLPQPIITNEPFFPDIDVARARENVRIDGTITEVRLVEALTEAMSNVNNELANYQQTQQTSGYNTLADVPSPLLNGESKKIFLYHRAVYAMAKANMIERYRDYDATGKAEKYMDNMERARGDMWRDARWAIRDIQELPRNTVALL